MTRNLSLLRLLGAALGATLAVACAPGASSPPSDPSSAQNFGGADMPPGTHVQVMRQGQWYAAVVVQPMGDGHFRVHYDNTGNEWDETVGLDRIKPLPGSPGSFAAGPARDYRPGERVLVTYQNRLLAGEVIGPAGEGFRVHYDGFGPEAAENVPPERMRRPYVGVSGHAVGESLMVDVNGTLLPAKVLALSAVDRWLVRFDNFGPQYDQEVGVDRIKAATAVAPPHPPPPPAEPPPPAKPEKVVEKGKAKPAPGNLAPAVPSGPPSAGEDVLVAIRGAWFQASVSAVGASAVKVKYPSGSEEEVPADRIVRSPGSTRGLQYQPGQLVLVEYKGIFVPARVLRLEGKDVKVRFDGQGPEGDEVVTTKRLRPR